MITKADIEAAAERIAGRVRRTPVLAVEPAAFGVPLLLKLEYLQHSGSFKARGAFNRLLSEPVPAAGVVAASGGNHGLAVAYAARELGVAAEVFVPESAAAVKVQRLRAYGARVTRTGAEYAEAYAASQEYAERTGALVVHAYDQPEVQAGQGTVGRELAEQAPEITTVLVAVGGGGLIAGIATWFSRPMPSGREEQRFSRPMPSGREEQRFSRARVVAVEPRTAPTLNAALAAGEPVDVAVSGVAADALGARRITAGALAALTNTDTDTVSVLVEDKAILAARQALWDELRIAVEPAGAAALAALLSGKYQPEPGERLAVVCCGANTDPADLTVRPV
jgi:threonine dehydratase